MKKRTEITVEVERELLIRRPNASVSAWCPQCNQQVRMNSPEAAAALVGVSLREIFRQVEAGELHFLETPAGRMYICADSLAQSCAESRNVCSPQ